MYVPVCLYLCVCAGLHVPLCMCVFVFICVHLCYSVEYLQRIIQNQDEILLARDQEILQLKEANHRQSLFIEKIL